MIDNVEEWQEDVDDRLIENDEELRKMRTELDNVKSGFLRSEQLKDEEIRGIRTEMENVKSRLSQSDHLLATLLGPLFESDPGIFIFFTPVPKLILCSRWFI
jgi:SMC interacting uncharacterized protein involved in chromosome segregation